MAAGTATKSLLRELGTPTGANSLRQRDQATDWAPRVKWQTIERMRTDSRISSVRRITVAPVRTATWRLETEGVRPEIVSFVTQQLGFDGTVTRAGGRHNRWADYLHHALLGLDYGSMPFELVADYTDKQFVLRKLAARAPYSITEWKTDDDGGLIHLAQYRPSNSATRLGGKIELPVDRLAVHVWPRVELGNWEGTSLFRTAYKHYALREQLYELDGIAADRSAVGIPTAEVPIGGDSDAMLDQLALIRSGANSGAAFPAGSNFQLLGVKGNTHDLMASISHHAQMIAETMLGHVLTLGHDNGARALGDTFAEYLATAQNEVAAWLGDHCTEFIISKLVAWNWGVDEVYPRLIHTPIRPTVAATAENLKFLVDAGIIIPDVPLDEWARTLVNAPKADPATARDPIPVVAPAAPMPTKRSGSKAKAPSVADLASRASTLVEQLALM